MKLKDPTSIEASQASLHQYLSKVASRASNVKIKLLQSPHHNGEDLDTDFLNIGKAHNASQRQPQFFHMMPHIQRIHRKTEVDRALFFPYVATDTKGTSRSESQLHKEDASWLKVEAIHEKR